jgi:adenylate cyclase
VSGETKRKLLIVDDEPDMLDFLERVLRTRFDVYRTSSAETAMSMLAGGDFEVLITDQKMPRVSGLELLERVARQHPTLVKLLISGYSELPEIQKAVQRGNIHNYVVKPVDSERLVEAVDEAYAVRDGRAYTPEE